MNFPVEIRRLKAPLFGRLRFANGVVLWLWFVEVIMPLPESEQFKLEQAWDEGFRAGLQARDRSNA